jgi:hypothetical protein
MIRTHTTALIGSLLLATALAGCTVGPPPRFTAEDVRAAEQSGSLPQLYDQVAAELATLDPDSKNAAETRALLESIGARLTDQTAQEVKTDLANNLLSSDRYPLDLLDQQIALIEDVKEWDPARYERASATLQAERSRTVDEITATERELETLGDDKLGSRLQLLGHLTELLGPGSAAYGGYAAERAKILDQLRGRSEQSTRREE